MSPPVQFPFVIICPRCGTEAMVDPRRPHELACPERTCQAATTDGVWDYGYGGEKGQENDG